MYHSPGVLLVCGGTSCSSLMKTGKKWRRKLAYSAVCTISMESRTSLASSTRLSIPAGTNELQLTLPLSLRGCSLVIFTWPQCACHGGVKHAAGPPCSAGHLTPLASLALQCWPAAALKVQHQLVWPLLQSSLASRGDLLHDGQPHTLVKTCTQLTQVLSLLASLDTLPSVLLSRCCNSAPLLSYKLGKGLWMRALLSCNSSKEACVAACSLAGYGLLFAPVSDKDARQSLTGHGQKRIAVLLDCRGCGELCNAAWLVGLAYWQYP